MSLAKGEKNLKKFKHLVIGGIQNKLFNIVLLSVILLAIVFVGVMQYQSKMLTRLTAETNQKQEASVSGIATAVLDETIRSSMLRSTSNEAARANELFDDLKFRVQLMGEYAGKLLSNADQVPAAAYYEPDAAMDGTLSAMVLYANDDAAADEALAVKIGVAANMTDMMIAVCSASGANNAYISLPEGATLTVNAVAAGHFDEDGSVNRFDAASRPWYLQAVQAGELIFTDVSTDTGSGLLCVTCAMPVYDEAGALLAVVGSDLFMDQMQATADASLSQGGYLFVVNQNGHVVIEPAIDLSLRVRDSADADDLRQSSNTVLASFIASALEGKADIGLVTVDSGTYYICSAPMETTGWAMISLYDRSLADQPVDAMKQELHTIEQDAVTNYNAQMSRIKNIGIAVTVAATVLLLAASLLLGKKIVKPLNTITKRISEISETNLEFKMEDAYRTGDEIELMAQSFADISHRTVQYVDEVKRVTAEKERIGTELDMAKQIQASMLPHMFPPYPERREFDLYATMTPAKEVGGDFYDFFLIDDDHLCLVMADVSGKGVPAALFMMVSKVILQSCAMLGRSAAEILQKTNDALCHDNQVEMFVTVWVGILEISTGKLTAANAGHEYPALKKGAQFALYKDRHGFVIGGMEGVNYKEYELQLEPGDKLFVYTDGVTEATDAENRLFGTDRMLSALNKAPQVEPKEILTNVRDDIDAFVGQAEQFDDLTMLCLEYKGTKNKE